MTELTSLNNDRYYRALNPHRARKPQMSFLYANGGNRNIVAINILPHFKESRTYDASNPAERVCIPGGCVERSAEYSAHTPRNTAMHASTHSPQPATVPLCTHHTSERRGALVGGRESEAQIKQYSFNVFKHIYLRSQTNPT